MIKHSAPFSCVLVLMLALGSAPILPVADAAPSPMPATDNACSLLTQSDVSAALEIQSLPGKPAVPGSSKACMWSDSPDANIGNRRVTVSITSSTTAFEYMKSSPRIKIEAVSGIGDEAFYEMLNDREAPILQVRKGGSVFTLRILNGLKSKAFTLDEAKAKEATLARAAAAKF